MNCHTPGIRILFGAQQKGADCIFTKASTKDERPNRCTSTSESILLLTKNVGVGK
jgi:hypothetical protein